MKNLHKRILILFIIAISAMNLKATIIYVNASATGSNNGTSWTDAFISFQSALDVAVSGDQIWVAKGVYYATSSFILKTGVEVYGGFVGTETLITERDWQLNKTILSGDIGQDDVNTDGNFITESWSEQVGLNADHVVVAPNGVDNTTRLDGFIVTAGSATTNFGGGGIINWNSSPSYYNLEICGNQGPTYGGGMLNVSSSAHVENVLFDGNRLTDTSLGGYGGGMYNLYNAAPVIIHVIFNNNNAYFGGGYGCSSGSPYFEDVIFSNNMTINQGYGGGAYFHDGANATLNDVTFIQNQSHIGGGIYSFRYGSLTMNNVAFIENKTLNNGTGNNGGGLSTNSDIIVNATNVSFIGNVAADNGGGAYFGSDCTASLTNCLFLGNHALNRIGGGLSANWSSTVTLTNTTFNGNRALIGGGAIGTIYGDSEINAINSIMWGNYPDEVYEVYGGGINISYSNVQQDSGVYEGTGNINSDPQFIDPADALEAPSTFGDLRINGFSPCVDIGENSYNTEISDIRGQARIQNTTIDMGSYEWTDGVDPSFIIYYVDLLATGNNDGSNWTDAFTSFQSALDNAVSGDKIWVAKGTYKPGSAYDLTNTSRYYHFRMKEGVEIYGGFAGTEISANQRTNYGVGEENETILSGDLNGDDDFDVNNGGYQTTTGDDNCYHVFYHPDGINLTSSAILDGFTISGGNANDVAGNPHHRAGGFYASSSSPTIQNVVFKANSANNIGGAVYIYNSNSNFTNVSFISNKSFNNGGAIYLNGGLPTLDQFNCNQNYSANGGAIYVAAASPIITNAIFTNNNSTSDGGAFSSHSSSIEITNALFANNVCSQNGGALELYSLSTPFSSTFSNVTITNNSAPGIGGGICFKSSASSNIVLNNSIVYGNTATTNGNEIASNSGGGTTLNYSCYDNSTNDIFVEGGTFVTTNNNITDTPLFVDAAAEDYRLFSESQAVNTGDNSYNTESYDIRGEDRIQNTTIDMGAYEWTPGMDPYGIEGILYVDVNASGLNTGNSWTDAFASLQSALDVAINGDQVWVAKGIYNPGFAYDLPNTSRYYHFRMIEGVELYGGFAGTETSINERTNFGIGDANETILSGDLNGDDVVSGNGETLTFANHSENCYHVIYNTATLTSSSVLNGFTVQGGNGDGTEPFDRGAGIFNSWASPSLTNVTFTANCGQYAGGICNLNSSPIITNCLVYRNKALTNSGGIENSTSSSPILINTTIVMNTATYNGGGMLNYDNCSPILKNCIIWGNISEIGNQVYITGGGTTTLNYSCYSNGENDVVAVSASDIFVATNNNITSYPLFIESENGDLRINGSSLCVNTGDNSFNTETFDIRGQARIQNTTIDMGAYEWTDGVDPVFYVFYVDLLASGNNDGSSWNNAFTSLQSALDNAVSGDKIWVAKGTYKPGSAYDLTNTSRYYHFRMKEGVEIYGGFAGTEISANQRTNYGVGEENETILSGDLNGDDVVSGSGETLTLSNYSENCYHVIYNPDPLTSASLLNGFTVKSGNANGTDPHDRGSGILNYTASPSITNVILTENGGTYGGGIYSHTASPCVTNCLIYANKTQNGAGIENKFSSPTYINTTIALNLASGYGGGMNNYNDCEPVFNNCIIWGNIASTGNQIYASSGYTTTLNYSCYSNQDNDVVMSSTTFTADNNNITIDPNFVNVAEGDYRIYGNSPANNSGLNSFNTTSIDLRGKSRIQNTIIDMGAYEWTQNSDPFSSTGIIYVNLNASGANNGSSWADAFTSLQSALDWVSSGYQIWVAKGTYKPNSAYDLTNTSRYYHFRMIEGVEIYGGFAGTETDVSERTNFGVGDANETILSGDLNGDDVVSGSGETLTLSNYSENCYHVIYNPDPLTSASILNGFTVRGGNGDGTEPFDRGAGILNYSASPSLTNVTFTANTGAYGGGICNYDASPIITNCLIYGNKTTNNSAGIENSTSSSPILINTTIAMNTATYHGGGMLNYNNCSPILKNCIVWGNLAESGNQISIMEGGTTTLYYSCYSNSANDVVLSSGSFSTNGSITVDPCFVDATARDFRLFGNSPAVNAGNYVYNSESRDIRGQTRTQDANIDMGAYEWTSGVDPAINVLTWTGNTDSDWNTPGNWSENMIPTQTCTLIIPDVGNDPVVFQDPDNPAICQNLTIQSNAVLSVAAGKALTVTGVLNNNAGNAGIVLKSDASGTASLIHQSSGVNATVQRHIPKYEANNSGWHDLASPVAGQAIRPEFVASPSPNLLDDFYKWDEVTNYWINTKDGNGNWNTNFEDNFVVGRGYNVAFADNADKTFTGELNAGDFTFGETTTPSITYTESGGFGWNLMGNPYASGLDWDECERTNIDAAVYTYDGDGGQYASWNGTTGALADGIIPPMNGFFVKASAGASLTIPNSARVHTATNFYKENAYIEDLLVLKVEGNGFSDKTFIHFNPDATNGFDKDFDAYKLSGIAAAPQLFTEAGTAKLSINELPYSTKEIIIPLKLIVGENGEYTISLAQNTCWENVDIALQDLETQITYDLKTTTHLTNIHTPNSSADRFLLLINGATVIGETEADGGVEIFSYGELVFISSDVPDPMEVMVFNMLGQQVLSKDLPATQGLTCFKLNRGFFLIILKTDRAVITKKVWIQ